MEYYHERIKNYISETYRDARTVVYVRGARCRRGYVLKHDRYILMFDFDEFSTIPKSLLKALKSGDIWIVKNTYDTEKIFEVVLSKPLLIRINNSNSSRKDGNYQISSKRLEHGILLLHTANNQGIEIPVGEINLSA